MSALGNGLLLMRMRCVFRSWRGCPPVRKAQIQLSNRHVQTLARLGAHARMILMHYSNPKLPTTHRVIASVPIVCCANCYNRSWMFEACRGKHASAAEHCFEQARQAAKQCCAQRSRGRMRRHCNHSSSLQQASRSGACRCIRCSAQGSRAAAAATAGAPTKCGAVG